MARWWRPSIRLRAALGAGLAAAIVFGVGAVWLRELVYADRMRTAVIQAEADARSIAEAYARNGPSGPVPDPSVAWTILRDDSGLRVMATTGELEPFVAGGVLTIDTPPGPDDMAGTVTASLGNSSDLGYVSPLENRSVTLAYARSRGARAADRGAAPPATVYVVASPLPAEEARAALDRGFAAGLPFAVLLVALIARMVTGRALRPVEAIRAELSDITARRLGRRVPVPPSGDEIARLAVTTNATLDRLERSVAQQRRFVADAAHELRSPLANLRSSLEVATVHADRADWPAVVRTALADTTRLQELTDDLLLLARLDRALPLPDRVVDLAALVDEQVAERCHREQPAGYLTARTDAPARVRGDEAHLGRLLRNLLDNAARHARGAVEVAVGPARGGGVVLEVRDDGPGIAPADRERVFERFTRLDDARGRDEGGAGLGLAIVRDIATRHGGTVRIGDSVHGTRVVVRLPAFRRGRLAPPTQPPNDVGTTGAAGSPPGPDRAVRPARRAAALATVTLLIAVSIGASVPIRPGPVGQAPVEIFGGGSLIWAGGSGGHHLLRLVQLCSTCTTGGLYASTDGGAAWAEIANTPIAGGMQVLGPDIVMVLSPRSNATTWLAPPSLISFDGGHHWIDAIVGEPIAAAPAGGVAICWPLAPEAPGEDHTCTLHVADPQTRRIRPLSTPPPMSALVVNRVPPDAGLWVSGVDRATGRPAVSVSHDRGRTWSTHAFPELDQVTVEQGVAGTAYLPEVASADGRVAYLVLFGRERWHAYRTGDGGLTWSATVLAAETVDSLGGGLSYVTQDNTHMLATFAGGGVNYLGCPVGATVYRSVEGTQLPGYVGVSMLGGGSYLAYSDRVLYLSDDGWNWRLVWHE
jgi:signal transduction histidine kinase